MCDEIYLDLLYKTFESIVSDVIRIKSVLLCQISL